MMLKVYQLLVGSNGLIENEYDLKTGIMKLGLISYDEDLSIHFVDTLFNKLGSFYIEKSIERELNTYNILRAKVNSLYGQMTNKVESAARYADKTLGLWQETEKLPAQIYTRDANITAMVYGEALKNLEIAEFSLKSKVPFIQEIDAPIAPITPSKKSKIIFTAIGVLIGGFLGVVLISLLKGNK